MPAAGHTPSKPRLGRGLQSLIIDSTNLGEQGQNYQPQAGAPPSPGQTGKHPLAAAGPTNLELPINQIAPNPHQPRTAMDEEQLANLAKSIARDGILQPLIVTRSPTPGAERPYVLVAGERRLRAAERSGLASVPCIVRDATEQQMLQWAVIENIQRADLNPVDRGSAYREMMDRFTLTQAEVAEYLGEPRATIANYLRILDLPGGVREMVSRGELSFGHGKVLAGLAGKPELQLTLAKRTLRGGSSVRRLEEIVGSSLRGDGDTAPAARGRRAKGAHVMDLESQLSHAVGTRVQIMPGRAKHAGRLVIEYYSLDDFDRIAAGLGLNVES